MKNIYYLNDYMRKYELIFSDRKTISIKIKENGELEVRAPKKISKEKIDSFVKSKEKWIKKHSTRIANDYNLKSNFKLNFGDSIKITGKLTQIHSTEGKIAKYENNEFLIPKTCDSDEIRHIIMDLAKKIAKLYITKRVLFFKNIMNIEPTAIKITNAKTRWGSCSGKNSINFSWRIIMANEDIIDYIVVHELAHIKQHNHSKEFWREVENIIPNYIEIKEKLKLFEKKINKENWN